MYIVHKSVILMWTHFANNEPFLLLNKNYASYHNHIICNEFGIVWWSWWFMMIMQFHNLTNTVNRWTLAKKVADLANNQIMTATMAGMPANWLSLIFLASVHLLKLLPRLWNCVIIMRQKIPHSLPIVWLVIECIVFIH